MSIEITDCFTCMGSDSVSTLQMLCFNMEKFISYLPEVPGWKVTDSEPEIKYSCCVA